jgi:hypothetical protein
MRGFKKLRVNSLKGLTLEIYSERFIIPDQVIYPIVGVFGFKIFAIFIEFLCRTKINRAKEKIKAV